MIGATSLVLAACTNASTTPPSTLGDPPAPNVHLTTVPMIPVPIPSTDPVGTALAVAGGARNWSTINRELMFVPWHEAVVMRETSISEYATQSPEGYRGVFTIAPLMASSAITRQYVSVVYPVDSATAVSAGDGSWADSETISLASGRPIDVTGAILHDRPSVLEVERAFWPIYHATLIGHGSFFGCDAGDLWAGSGLFAQGTFADMASMVNQFVDQSFVFAISREHLVAVTEPGTFADMACGWHVLAIPWTQVPRVRALLASRFHLSSANS